MTPTPTPAERRAHITKAQEFFFKGGARLYDYSTPEVLADAVLYAAAALHFATLAGGDAAVELAITTLQQLRKERYP